MKHNGRKKAREERAAKTLPPVDESKLTEADFAEIVARKRAGANPDPRVHPDRPFHMQVRKIGDRYYYVAPDGSFRRLAPEDVAKIEGRG